MVFHSYVGLPRVIIFAGTCSQMPNDGTYGLGPNLDQRSCANKSSNSKCSQHSLSRSPCPPNVPKHPRFAAGSSVEFLPKEGISEDFSNVSNVLFLTKLGDKVEVVCQDRQHGPCQIEGWKTTISTIHKHLQPTIYNLPTLVVWGCEVLNHRCFCWFQLLPVANCPVTIA